MPPLPRPWWQFAGGGQPGIGLVVGAWPEPPAPSLEALVPYGRLSMIDFLGSEPEQFVSAENRAAYGSLRLSKGCSVEGRRRPGPWSVLYRDYRHRPVQAGRTPGPRGGLGTHPAAPNTT